MKKEFVVEATSSGELQYLRWTVLRGGSGAVEVGDPRDNDPASIHLAIRIEGAVVACGSFFNSISPMNSAGACMQLRFLATSPNLQGRGLSTALLENAETRLLHRGIASIWANARDAALTFYLERGWVALPDSEHVSLETQLAHTVIVKQLHR